MQPRFLAALVLVTVLAGCGGHSGPRLTVGPNTSLVDQPVQIEVSGVRPGTLVRLSAAEDGWVGTGVFRADRRGTVSPARQPSLRGTYTGLARMGLFWSMKAGAGLGPYFGGTVDITAHVQGAVVGRATLTRLGKADGVTATPLSFAESGFLGRYTAPRPVRASGSRSC